MSTPICHSPWGLVQYYVIPQQIDSYCVSLMQSVETVLEPTPVMAYLSVFLLTCLLESPFYGWTLKAFRSGPGFFQNLWTLISATAFANLCTHPAVYFGFPYIGIRYQRNYAQILTLAEIFAPLLEALVLIFIWKVPAIRAFTIMILANLFSWWAGVFLTVNWELS